MRARTIIEFLTILKIKLQLRYNSRVSAVSERSTTWTRIYVMGASVIFLVGGYELYSLGAKHNKWGWPFQVWHSMDSRAREFRNKQASYWRVLKVMLMLDLLFVFLKHSVVDDHGEGNDTCCENQER